MLLSEWSSAVCLFSDSCSWVSCLSWTVKLSAVLWKNHSAPTNSLVFQHFCVFEPFPTMTVWCWDLFTPRTTEGLIYNYYRRFKHSLMLQKKNTCIKSLFEFEDQGKFNWIQKVQFVKIWHVNFYNNFPFLYWELPYLFFRLISILNTLEIDNEMVILNVCCTWRCRESPCPA